MFSDPKDKLFCEVGIDLGLLNKDQVAKALEQQNVDRAIGNTKPIGAYLFEANILTKEQIAQILKIQEKYEQPAVKPELAAQEVKTAEPKSENEAVQKAPAEDNGGCGAFAIGLIMIYLGGWGLVWGQEIEKIPWIGEILVKFGTYDFIFASRAVLISFNNVFYGIVLSPRFFESAVVSWVLLILGLNMFLYGGRGDSKGKVEADN